MFSILIIDDMSENLSALINLLKKDYQVKIANNSQTALKILERNIPDLILLDIIMPDINGYNLCKLIKDNQRTKEIPVIFITAMQKVVNEVKGFKLGAVDYITKPFNPLIVRSRIKAHLALADQNKLLKFEVFKKTKELYDTRLEIIQKLSKAAEYKDSYTGKHIERVSSYSYIIAKEFGMSEEECELIYNAAPMHDIGKIGIPDEILKKKGSLNKKERSIMSMHPAIGANIIGNTNVLLLQIAKNIAMEHHEKWDGSGYPMGIKGRDINIFARIVSIADTFDALLSERPYKDKWPIDKSVQWIKDQAGISFDPEIIKVFINSVPEIIKKYENLKD